MQRYGDHGGGARAPGTDRAARWTLRLLAVAVFVAVIAAVLAASLLSLDGTGPAPTGRDPGQAAGPATVEDLGPEPGVELAAYTGNRRAALAAATGDRMAVVSLAAYATEAQARAVAGTLEVVALLVAPAETAPSVVSGSLVAWASGETARIRAERDEIRKLIPTVTDAAFKAFYTSEVDRLDKAANALTPAAAIVFGVVVRGPVPALRVLGTRPEVRLVDVGPASEPGARATYRGIRPEERSVANDPSTRPA